MRILLSGVTISAWYYKYHFQENYCKAISFVWGLLKGTLPACFFGHFNVLEMKLGGGGGGGGGGGNFKIVMDFEIFIFFYVCDFSSPSPSPG